MQNIVTTGSVNPGKNFKNLIIIIIIYIKISSPLE